MANLEPEPIASPTLRSWLDLLKNPYAYLAEVYIGIASYAVADVGISPRDGDGTMIWLNKLLVTIDAIITHPIFLIVFGIYAFWMLRKAAADVEERKVKLLETDQLRRADLLTEANKAFDTRFAALDILTDFAASDYEFRLTAERVFAIRPKIEAALAWQPRAEFSRESEGPLLEGNHMFSLLASDAAWIGQDYPRPVFETMQPPVLVKHERSFVKVRTYDATSNANFEAMLQTNKKILSDAHSKLEAILTDQEQRRNAELSKLRRIKGQERI